MAREEGDGTGRLSVPLDAVLFDMDGVVTDTARAHAYAWKALFDEFLAAWSRTHDDPFEPFDLRDYHALIDGKPRLDGVRDYLTAHGIAIPEGTPDDPSGLDTMHALARRKQDHFVEWLETNPVEAFPGAVRLLQALRARGVRTALFTSSRNADLVLDRAGVRALFDAKVDGNDLERLGLPGKPAPDVLLEAARRLGVPPARAAAIEDAVAGVEAAARGGFALVVGVSRGADEGALRDAGADLVVHDLDELRLGEDRRLTFDRAPASPEDRR